MRRFDVVRMTADAVRLRGGNIASPLLAQFMNREFKKIPKGKTAKVNAALRVITNYENAKREGRWSDLEFVAMSNQISEFG